MQLKKELENLQCYVKIQSIRFPGNLMLIYNVEEDMLTCEMLKFILQPLMENANGTWCYSMTKEEDG